MYGRWGWRGILAYPIGFAAMTPFFSVGTLYEGAAARALDGADISFFVGLPVAGLLYYAFSGSASFRLLPIGGSSGPALATHSRAIKRLTNARQRVNLGGMCGV